MMNVIEVLKGIMTESGLNQNKLAKRLNISQQGISDKFKKDDIGVKKLLDILRVMDYKLVIMPNDKRTPEGGYEVD